MRATQRSGGKEREERGRVKRGQKADAGVIGTDVTVPHYERAVSVTSSHDDGGGGALCIQSDFGDGRPALRRRRGVTTALACHA